MDFFDRKRELALLAEIEKLSHRVAQLTVVTGRRRVGKTSLILKASAKTRHAYLFVERKNERDLCETFKEELEERLGVVIHGHPSSFLEILEEALKFSVEHPVTLIIDEFQELRKVNDTLFSGIQKLWDLYKDRAKMNLIVSGSVYTLMQKIFKSKKAALYGRETAFLKLEPFGVSTLKEILGTYRKRYTPEDLLALWTFTGGVAKYVEILMDHGAVTRDKMIDLIIREDSIFLEEGRAVLVDEFDREYGTYFSILSVIAQGRNTRNEIAQAIGRDVGGYLDRLENDYALIVRKLPLFAKESSRGAHFELNDSFFRFWFRFVFKYSYLLQIRGYEKLRQIVRRDYDVFSGTSLERYFREKFIESGEWTRIGNWWDRKGENEIDLIAEDELSGRLVIAEIKRDKSRIDMDVLREKISVFVKTVRGKKKAEPELLSLSLEDM